MGLRWRKDGRLLCAAMSEWESGDVYFDDEQLEKLSRAGIIVPDQGHHTNGVWHWTAHLIPWWARSGELSDPPDEQGHIKQQIARLRERSDDIRRNRIDRAKRTARFWTWLDRHITG